MNYYPHHIGDFRSGTFNMTREERWVYRDMIDVYYDMEGPFPDSLAEICKLLGVRRDEDKEVVADILVLKFELRETGYHNDRCDKEIAAYKAKAEVAQNNGKKGGRPAKNNPKKPSGLFVGSDPVPAGNPQETESQANQEPRTKNQEPEEEEEQNTCAAAPAVVDPVPAEPAGPANVVQLAYTLPTNTGEEFQIAIQRVEEFTEIYPGVNVMQELRKMRGWLISNPAKCKTKKGMMAFVNNWLAKQQNDGGSQGGARRVGPANGRPSINDIGVPAGADDDIFNQMRKELP